MKAKSEQEKVIKELKAKIVPVLKKYGVVRAGLFGSVVRGEAKKKSDIDILVEFESKAKMSLLDFVGLKLELEGILGKKADLVEYSTIKPLIKDQILAQKIDILSGS